MMGSELEWVQPRALKMEYELRAGDEVVATLRFRSSFGSFATAESADVLAAVRQLQRAAEGPSPTTSS